VISFDINLKVALAARISARTTETVTSSTLRQEQLMDRLTSTTAFAKVIDLAFPAFDILKKMEPR